jgi:hypothetical protein
MNLSDFYKLVDSNPPAFHYWDNEPKVGGLDKPYFEWLESLGGLLGRSGEKVVVETGAGLSTLFFLSSSYSVHSFGMPYTINLIGEYLLPHPNISGKWFPHSGESELALPIFSKKCNNQPASLCLIDGSHSIPAVFSDFCHVNALLCDRGVLVVDDTQLPGPQLLVQMLTQLSGDWKNIGSFSKGIAFQKLSHRPYWADNMEKMQFHFPG